MGSVFSIRLPDTSRNTALAGKTVSSGGMNLTYNSQGFVESMTNYGHSLFAGTEKSVRAPSAEAVLAAGDRGSYGGSSYDKARFTDRELAAADELRQQAADGALAKWESDYWIDEIRRRYGYTGGESGNEYIAVTFPTEGEPERSVSDAAVYAEPAESVQTASDTRVYDAPAESAKTAEAASEARAHEVSAESADFWRGIVEKQRQQQSLLGEIKTAVGRSLAESGERGAERMLYELLEADEKEEEKGQQ